MNNLLNEKVDRRVNNLERRIEEIDRIDYSKLNRDSIILGALLTLVILSTPLASSTIVFIASILSTYGTILLGNRKIKDADRSQKSILSERIGKIKTLKLQRPNLSKEKQNELRIKLSRIKSRIQELTAEDKSKERSLLGSCALGAASILTSTINPILGLGMMIMGDALCLSCLNDFINTRKNLCRETNNKEHVEDTLRILSELSSEESMRQLNAKRMSKENESRQKEATKKPIGRDIADEIIERIYTREDNNPIGYQKRK